MNDRCKALASSLATFFKIAGLSNSRVNAALDRCYTFNAKDKKMFKFKTNKKVGWVVCCVVSGNIFLEELCMLFLVQRFVV